MSAIVIGSIVFVYLFFPMNIINGIKNRLMNRWKKWAEIFGLDNEES